MAPMKKRTRAIGAMPRRIGDGTRRMVDDPKQGRSRVRKATRASRRDEAWGERETGGSGRSSDDAKGQHNPSGVKDPWGSGVPSRGEDRPDMPLANGSQRSSSRVSTKRDVKPGDGEGRFAREIRSAVLEPYWGKPAVRNLRGGIENVAHG